MTLIYRMNNCQQLLSYLPVADYNYDIVMLKTFNSFIVSNISLVFNTLFLNVHHIFALKIFISYWTRNC